MAKTLNYPLTKTVLSAEGSAEVLGRGTNEYTDLWSADTDTDWSLWDTFPTVVRFGNYVYCWSGTTSLHSYYILIDVVEDPESDTELGSNLAFRELSNDTSNTVSNVLISKEVITASLTDGPYTSLTIGNKYIGGGVNLPRAGFEHADKSFDKFTPVFTSGTISDILISCNSAVIANSPRLRGWGDYSTMKGTNGDVRYGLFAPFATKEQFEFIYGKEHNWSNPNAASDDWLFEVESGSASTTVTYSGDLSYPFTVEAMVPNALYRDVPGDTTGDGIDNTPSLEDALAILALGTVVVKSAGSALNPTKCIDFPPELSFAGIDISAITNKIDTVKASIDSALSSAALSELGEKLKGLKADLLGLLPKMPTIHNIVLEIAGLDPKDRSAIEELNEKWKDVVGDVTGFFDDLTEFDICSLIGIDAKDGKDGKIEKKPEQDATPDKDIEEPVQNANVPTRSKNTPQDPMQAATGYTWSKADDAKTVIGIAWASIFGLTDAAFWDTQIRDDPFPDEGEYPWAYYIKNRDKWVIEFDEFNKGVDQQKIIAAASRKEPVPSSISTVRILDLAREEQALFEKGGFLAVWVRKVLDLAKARIQYLLVIAAEGDGPEIKAGDDPSSLWITNPVNGTKRIYVPEVGETLSLLGYAKVTEEMHAWMTAVMPQINRAIQTRIFNQEILSLVDVIITGAPREYKKVNTKSEERIIKGAGSDGDASDDSINGTPSKESKNVVPGNVTYSYGSKTIRNQNIQPSLMRILEASAAEKNYSLVVYSGGQDYKGKGKNRTGSIRHDGGFAADIRTYNENGRRLSASSNSSKDISALSDFVSILIKNGITSVGADDDYMNGNLHVDIATNSAATCWGASGDSYRRIYAPAWLVSKF